MSSNKEVMKYHQPDDRWTLWSLNDFPTYCEQAVVEGRFHPVVPKDVREAFIMAEYMMAHAYYHYPLYHEAFSKVLRIIEMAVKLRCGQLNIPLDHFHKGRKRMEKKVLKMLMDDLVKAEQAKELELQFTVARNLRNSTMHPERHTYSGAMTKSYIENAVNLLNTLFLPASLFADFSRQLQAVKIEMRPYQKGLFVLETETGRYLVEGLDVEAAVFMNDEWHYLLAGYPIMLNAYENLTQHSYVKPLIFDISKLHVTDEGLHAKGTSTGKILQASATKDAANQESYQQYLSELGQVGERERTMYRHHNSHEVGERKMDFLYRSLWKLTLDAAQTE
jgi:hypothetical protein